jgi:hypothetical protein
MILRHRIGIGLFGLGFFYAALAEAQPGVPVALHPDRDLVVTLRDPKHDYRIARCAPDCLVYVPEGRYEVSLADRFGKNYGAKKLRVRRPMSVQVSRPDDSARTTGLTLGIVGPILAVGGVVMLTSAALSSMSHGGADGDSSQAELALVGLTAFATGAVLTPVGWVMYARNRGPKLDIQETAHSGIGPLRVGFGAAPGRASLGAGFSF